MVDTEEIFVEHGEGDMLDLFYEMFVHLWKPLLGLFRYYND